MAHDKEAYVGFEPAYVGLTVESTVGPAVYGDVQSTRLPKGQIS